MLSHLCLKFKTEGLKQQETLNSLPKAIRSSISYHLFFPIVQSAYLFKGVSHDFLFQLVILEQIFGLAFRRQFLLPLLGNSAIIHDCPIFYGATAQSTGAFLHASYKIDISIYFFHLKGFRNGGRVFSAKGGRDFGKRGTYMSLHTCFRNSSKHTCPPSMSLDPKRCLV